MSEKKSYNYCLDFIKGIACMLVVFIHCQFPGLLGIGVRTIVRFCVPLFFMVSGYFCYNVNSKEHSSKKIKHIASITFYSSLFYLVFAGIRNWLFTAQSYNFAPSRFLIWAVFNSPIIIADQYWFLYALLYVYIFFFIIKKYLSNRQLYVLAIFLFILFYFLSQGAHLLGFRIVKLIYRNWLLEGFPFFMLGHFLHDYKDHIHISNKVLLTVFSLFTILCLLERLIMGRAFGVNLCTFPQVTALMIYAIKNPNHHKGIIQELGKRYSMLIYVVHPAVWHTMEEIYQKTGYSDNPPALYLMPIIVLISSIILSILFDYLKKSIQIQF